MQFIGIDIHTNRFTCCYLFKDTKEKKMATFELDKAGLAQFYQTPDAETYVLLEATINTFSFVDLWKDKVKEVLVANTYKLK